MDLVVQLNCIGLCYHWDFITTHSFSFDLSDFRGQKATSRLKAKIYINFFSYHIHFNSIPNMHI